mmetsp:Transcript_37758/g.53263  ORF Transcript_37758/g.53263 Transcript_37758/m.53263 type:complete len:384 (-) Transcript_37758:94-1245(-)|eukprot:CAMPEP_0202458362 /NCGR_PEP_ID=MMETSP1360-20130828/24496_1 /ASSEMBLY_ACC=CAM_ASM_000848 /TAXON_ID=515479 /ORGANISM="Licmophora paradoxa, Strain CCMP2313" /LENGTH=383 /DNA_ID=CAMNT_0049078873 /DNA_START=109 /DNA_END=1260 /DNA_ORIENTATION=-
MCCSDRIRWSSLVILIIFERVIVDFIGKSHLGAILTDLRTSSFKQYKNGVQNELKLFERLGCFAHRFTYSCDEKNLSLFISNRTKEFLHVEKIINDINDSRAHLTGDILVIGNSFAGQVGEALFCAFRSQIVHLSATDLYNGCLMPFPNFAEEKCDGRGIENACGMYLATATLKSGIRVHLANNHPWLFGGSDRLTAALDHLQIRPAMLGTIILGYWNGQSWAKDNFADKSRVMNKKINPIPQSVEDTLDANGNLHEFSRCGGGINTSDTVLLDRMTVPWKTDDVMEYFARRNFSGTMLMGTANYRVTYDHIKWSNTSQFKIEHVENILSECNVPGCIPMHSHSCMPGEPFLFLKEVLRVAIDKDNENKGNQESGIFESYFKN